LPPSSVNSLIGQPFLVLDKVDSTNNYAMGLVHAGLAKHGQACFAHHQFAGKGQRGKEWNSPEGENITMSVVLDAKYLNNIYPFLLSASVALACIDLLNELVSGDLKIKWPNDLYWRDRKAGGILIENIYQANEWKHAIVGIGININQTVFSLPGVQAISLNQITGQKYNPLELARQLCEKLDGRYRQLGEGNHKELMEEYNQLLLKKKEAVKLKKGNILFETIIEEVSPAGQLLTSDIIERRFEFGEVEWAMRVECDDVKSEA